MEEVESEDGFVEVPGGQVFAPTWTSRTNADGPPIVLLHDSLGCVDLSRDFPERLAGRLARTVVAYDQLGFGKSSALHELPSVNFIRKEAEVHWPAVRRALGIS